MSGFFSGLRRSAAMAALLSFVWPGLGHGWVGAWLRGAFFAIPIILLAVAGLLVFLAEGAPRIAGLLLQRDIVYGLLALNFGILVYRLAAIGDAYRLARIRWPAVAGIRRVIAAGMVAVLLLLTVGMHVAVGYLSYDYSTLASVFHTPDPETPTPVPSLASLAPDATPTAVPTPGPTPGPAWAADGRLNILLVGGDAGPGRWSLRTDTLELLSIEVSTGRAALFGIPRNLFNVPLPDGPAQHFKCRCYPDLINSIYVYAGEHPEVFPGSDEVRGYMALQNAIQEMMGLTIDGQVVVTLNGFVKLVDAFGGLKMTTPKTVYDTHYPMPDGSGSKTVYIPAGRHHFDGEEALEYARSRHGTNDYSRMQRQQLVLIALRKQINPCTVIGRIPELIKIAKSALWTNLPIESLPDILALGARVKSSQIAQQLLWPPYIDEYLGFQALTRIHQIAANPYKDLPVATPVPSGVPSGAPAPTPGTSSGC